MLNPALDGGFVAFTGTACWLLPAPAEPMQQAADVIPVITNAETLAEQIGDALRGPHRGGEAVRFSAPRQQARELSQLPTSQLRRTARPRPATQSACAPAAILPRPLMNRLAAHTQLPSDRGQRLAALDTWQSREAACFEHLCISSHGPKIRHLTGMSIYLCRGL